jgi:UPF0716 family protein affecting phage T7 exclusion
MRAWERWLVALAAFPTIAPGLPSTLVGLLIASPVIVRQVMSARQSADSAAMGRALS